MTTPVLVSPFPPEDLPSVWAWLNEFPQQNFDDSGPKSLAEFVGEMQKRSQVESTWGVVNDGRLCGIVAYLPYTPRSGTFHGICFTREVHGTGIARAAVSSILQELFASGVQRISAGFFSDNCRVHRFLAGLGAVDEGTMRNYTVRGGVAIDMRMVAFLK